MNDILDSRQLLAFAALARRGSFTLAAKDLFLTQSAISHTIKGLEEELGARLFDRIGRKAQLTQAGEQLQRHVERILKEMRDAKSGIDNLSKWGHSRLRVGASLTACQYILPTVLREFKQSFPKCVIKIEPADTPKLVELLNTNQIDLALMLMPEANRELKFHPLFNDELKFLVSPMHPWAQAKYPDRSTLPTETLILYNKTSYTFRMVSDYFRKEKIILSNFIELGSMEAIKELAKIGLGAGVIAPWVAQKELAEHSLVALPLGRKKLKRVWGVGHLRGRRLPLAEETFVGLCQSVTESWVQK
ncbi:MAG TPA: LysR family transcriptional regulator [Opitutaceae bacterium]|nr:LysR family transcriptional regulator [Opitutaceae bacterium]